MLAIKFAPEKTAPIAVMEETTSERLGIDPEKVKTADVADFTLLREVQRELGIYIAGTFLSSPALLTLATEAQAASLANIDDFLGYVMNSDEVVEMLKRK